MGQRSSPALKWSLRIFSLLSLFIGVGFIIWAVVIQNPPKSALPIGLLILGCFSMVLALMGFFHSVIGRCCLSVFLMFCVFVALGELAIVISCFTNASGAADNIVEYSEDQSENPKKYDAESAYNDVLNDIEIGRYIFLVAVLLELLALIAVIVIRIKFPYEADQEVVEEQASARSAIAQIQLESLKHSMGRGKASPAPSSNVYTASNKMNRTVTRKMTQKYGEFTQDPTYQRKWWQKLPGMSS